MIDLLLGMRWAMKSRSNKSVDLECFSLAALVQADIQISQPVSCRTQNPAFSKAASGLSIQAPNLSRVRCLVQSFISGNIFPHFAILCRFWNIVTCLGMKYKQAIASEVNRRGTRLPPEARKQESVIYLRERGFVIAGEREWMCKI